MIRPLVLAATLAGFAVLTPSAFAVDDPWSELEAVQALLGEGKAAAAAARLERLVERLPAHPGLRLQLATALAEAGRAGEGLAALEIAARGGARLEAERFAALFGSLEKDEAYRRTAAILALNAEPLGEAALAFEAGESDFFAESVAVDPADGAAYVGSLRRRKIVRVDAGGASREVATAADGLFMVIGMKVDAARRELLANTCDFPGARPPMIDPDPATAGTAAVVRLELPSGRVVARHAPVDPPRPLCFNDLVLARDGTAYLTTGDQGIWRMAPGDGPRRFVELPGRFTNGIALSADERTLYVSEYLEGVLRIDLESREVAVVETTPEAPLLGLDGLYVWKGGLLGVQNGSPALGDRLIWAPLDPSGRKAIGFRVLLRGHPLFSAPTTGAIAGDGFLLVANSQLDRLLPDGSLPPLDRLGPVRVLRLPLP